VKKEERMTVIFKKRKKRNLLFILSFCESLWVMIKIFFFISAFLQSCFFSLNQQYRMNEWLLSVVKKKVHTRASRESPSLLLTKRRVLYKWEKEKKNLILFHPLFLSHTTIIWYCLSSVYVPFFLSGPLNNSDHMRTWSHVQSCLEIRKCQHIYITYVTSTLNSYQYK